MEKSMDGRNDVKFEVGDRVLVTASNEVLSHYGCSCASGKEYVIERVATRCSDYKLVGHNWVKPNHIELVITPLTKAQWLIHLIEGKIGVQSGNTQQRWRYNMDKGYYESKFCGDWQQSDIYNLGESSRAFTLIEETEMTVREIEEALGVKNLVIVK